MKSAKSLFAALALAAMAVPAATLASGGGAETTSPYLPLDPPFVTNLMEGNRMRFVQVKMQVGGDEKELKFVQAHMPAVRDSVLMLLSEQKIETFRNVQEREKLRQECLIAVQAVMQQRAGKPIVNAVYFTDFVVQ